MNTITRKLSYKARTLSAIAIIALLATLVLSAAALRPTGEPVHSVRGHAEWHGLVGTPYGQMVMDQITISAAQEEDGSVHGTCAWTAVYLWLPGGAGILFSGYPWVIDIDTLVIDPYSLGWNNTAYVEGTVMCDPQGAVSGGSAVGTRQGFLVYDNGDNPSEDPDWLDSALYGTPSEIVAGNLTVR